MNKSTTKLTVIFVIFAILVIVSMIGWLFFDMDDTLTAYIMIGMFFTVFMIRLVDLRDPKRDLIHKGADFFQMYIWALIIAVYIPYALYDWKWSMVFFIVLAMVMAVHLIIESRMIYRRVAATVDKELRIKVKKTIKDEKKKIDEFNKRVREKVSKVTDARLNKLGKQVKELKKDVEKEK